MLFTDLVGSTELRSRLGEQAAEELRRGHDRLLSEAVEAHGGRVVKGLGDGIMATFAGASDAVAAAVAIQQGVDRQNRSSKAAPTIGVRVGISAGDVTVEDDDVHGTPVIEAARLCSVAAGGEILSSEMVRWLARGSAAAFIPRGHLELKGLPEPVPACEVTWEPFAGPLLPMPSLLTRAGRIFVGRAEELERLLRLWKEAMAGERRVALLAGEPGIGKTRLAVELAGAIRESGGVVMAGRCDEDLGVPYQPFVEALRHYVTSTEELCLGRYAGELARLLPDLTQLVGNLPEPLRSDPETERYRLFDALAAWLSDVSAEAPVLLVLDDLHWAAKPTLLLLRHVLRSQESLRLLVVATYRDTDIGRGHPMSDFLAELRRDGGVERLALSGFDAPAVAAFIEAAAGHSLDDEEAQELPRVVWRETEGNPFFVVEVMRHLAESRAIEQREGRWVLSAAVGDLGIPEGVRDVVGWRLSRLAEATNRLLATAAVVGLEFEPAVVERAAGVGEDEILAALEEATLAHLLVEVPGARYRFAHALVRATLYEELTGARRVALHRRVAQAIESLHGRVLDDHLPALAHHWARASAPAADTARAADYATRAGDRALAQLAHDEAVAYYCQALELLDVACVPQEDARRLQLLISKGQAQQRAGDPAHRETLLAAARLAESEGDAGALAQAALTNLRTVYFSSARGTDVERVAVLEAALAAQGPSDSDARARLLAALALERFWDPDRSRRRNLSDEALAMARRLDSPATLAYVLAARPFAIGSPDTLEERLALTAELINLAERTGDPALQCRARANRYRVLTETAETEMTAQALEAFARLAEDLGQPTLRWTSGLGRVARSILHCRLADAEREADEVLELGVASGQPDARVFWTLHRFCIRFDQGRLAEVEAPMVELHAALPHIPAWSGLVALMYSELGRPDDARAVITPYLAARFELPFDTTWLYGLTPFAGACAALDDHEAAAVIRARLEPYRSHLSVSGWGLTGGAVAHATGLLAAVVGDFDAAEADFQTAEELHERVAALAWLARTRLEWARMLLTRHQPGAAERARELLGRTLATARELGLASIERRAVELLSSQ